MPDELTYTPDSPESQVKVKTLPFTTDFASVPWAVTWLIPRYGLYTKAAIVHLTKCLAVAWGKYNITVNGVAPTFIRTPGTETCLSGPEFHVDVVERIAALHRIGEPMEVAGAVVFLASPAASLITGHTMLIDGGWTAR